MKDFDEIRPYETGEMRQAFEELLDDRQFNAVLKGFAPWLPKFLRKGLLRLAFTGVETPLQFQKRFMKPVVKYIIRKHTDGCTFDDEELRSKGVKESGSQHPTPNTQHLSPITYHPTPNTQPRYTFLTNHRDIVLDSAFLDVLLIDNGYPTTVEIGIGDNLLIYPWIKRLVRMNKAFIVRRGLTPRAMLESSQLMSRYIHHAVTEKHENIWLAQREGRAKDSDDRTQESVLKMLAMGANTQHPTPITQHLTPLNIVPLTISYERQSVVQKEPSGRPRQYAHGHFRLQRSRALSLRRPHQHVDRRVERPAEKRILCGSRTAHRHGIASKLPPLPHQLLRRRLAQRKGRIHRALHRERSPECRGLHRPTNRENHTAREGRTFPARAHFNNVRESVEELFKGKKVKE